ncbi:MAG: bifunctional precorrin-2 dehydrogenase/sirohydrochlorin ferrochelatase [Caldilineaceae bacterium]
MTEALQPVYPIFLTGLERKLTVVVGGGSVGERKILGLLAAQAQVRLISPQATPTLQQAAQAGTIEWRPRPYQPGDLSGAWLAFAATDQRAVNALVAQEAHMRGILCNVADRAGDGDFHTPAVHRQDGLVFAIGSSGRNPGRIKRVRDWLVQLCTKFDIPP